METTIVYWGYIVFIVPRKWIEYGVGYIIIRSPYIPHISSTYGGLYSGKGSASLPDGSGRFRV